MAHTILVTGATGTIGRDVLNELAKRGAAVRAGVRDQEKAKAMFGASMVLRPFDFENSQACRDSLKGVTKVLVLPPLMPNRVETINAFVDAAREAGVEHIVKISAINVDAHPSYTFGKWHAAEEQHIRNSGLGFTFLRPNSLMQNFINYFPPCEGVICLPWGKGEASFVDARDVARAAVEVLTKEGHEGKTYTLTGPSALGIADVATSLSDATKRHIKYMDVPEPAARDGMLEAGVAQWQVDGVMELHAINKRSLWATVTNDVESVTRQAATTFAQFARDYADRFR
jgi:uncharacterized protein YbjT (DUF2867 family)